MNKPKLSMCRICLVTNVRMYVVSNKNLQEFYEKLTDAPLVTEDRRPMLACFFCCNRLKQCCRFQQKCLKAEKLFARILNENYEIKLQVNHDQLEFSGYTISPTVHVIITNESQTESNVVEEELPDVCEGQDNNNQSESENEFQDVENLCIPTHHSESTDIPPQHTESQDIPAKQFKSYLEDNYILKMLKTETEGQEVPKNKRKANVTNRAAIAKKPKIDIQRTKLEDTTVAQKTEQPRLKNTQLSVNNSINVTAVGTNCRNNSNEGMDNRDINIHQRLCTKKKPYNCEICQRSFTRQSSLTAHIRVHTEDKPYKCEICLRSFTKKSDLTKHIRVHTEDKPYKCEICLRSFTKKSDFTKHIRVHTGEKPHKCEICLRSFTKKSDLTKHIRVHTGEKPHKCEICLRSFTKKSDLTKHIRVHTGKKPHKCDICLRSFIKKSALTSHIRVHTVDKPYKCEICLRCYSSRRYFSKHMLLHTGAFANLTKANNVLVVLHKNHIVKSCFKYTD